MCVYVRVRADEQGVTVTLDRFDPGRDQDRAGDSGRVPSALLPGDVLVPCLISSQTETDAVVQSEAELHHCFKVSVTAEVRGQRSDCVLDSECFCV